MALKNDLTEGSLHSHILTFAVPLIISNLLQALYNAVDMYFAGKYMGTAGLAAVAVSGPVMNVLITAVSGMGVGVSVLVGSLVGRKDDNELKKAANTSIMLYIVIAFFVTIIGLVSTPYILEIIKTPSEAVEYANSYLKIIFSGMVFTIGYNLICALQRGFGDSRSSMIFVAAAALTNILLDYIFLGRLNMGVSGAALATVISQALSLVLGISYFRIKKHIITFSPKEWCFHKKYALRLLRIGLPSALQQISLNVSTLALSGIVNTFGLNASAAYGIAMKVDSFAILPCSAVNDGVATVTSQNLGVGKEDRALQSIKEGIGIAMKYVLVVIAMILFFAPWIVSIFNKDPEVVFTASKYLRISCFMYFFYSIVYPMQGFLKGSGNAIYTLLNSLVLQYIVKIPLAYILSKTLGLGVYGVAVAWIFGPIFSMTSYALYMKRGTWRKYAQAMSEKK